MMEHKDGTDAAKSASRKPEDVADWEVRMTSGELIRVNQGVIMYSGDRYSIYRPMADINGLLFSAPITEVHRVRRLGQTSTAVTKAA